jgi:hypothetical protein
MGRQASLFFDHAERLGGLRAKIALAVHTRTTSTEAASAQDTAELIERLESGLDVVRRQFSRVGASGAPPGPTDESGQHLAVRPAPSGQRAEAALRRFQQTYLELMSQRELLLGDERSTSRRVTEAASQALDVERVSIWRVDEEVTKIRCVDLYQRREASHSDGVELFARDYLPYFQALQTQRTIAAHDAHTDPRTSCFSPGYLEPLGIGAMLDVPIWTGNSMVGVICHEHVGGRREWTHDEETFAYLMSSFVSLTLEVARRLGS